MRHLSCMQLVESQQKEQNLKQLKVQQDEIMQLCQQRDTALQFGLAAESELHEVEKKLALALNTIDLLKDELSFVRETEQDARKHLIEAKQQLDTQAIKAADR